ncbi:MAG: hypothetical protein HC910_05050 [Spirulinaceae cyanobacterium SM2_1_0]|nr:hypothetical protein [Spirulinaceae cyanobacterium SM2_1_0]
MNQRSSGYASDTAAPDHPSWLVLAVVAEVRIERLSGGMRLERNAAKIGLAAVLLCNTLPSRLWATGKPSVASRTKKLGVLQTRFCAPGDGATTAASGSERLQARAMLPMNRALAKPGKRCMG